MFVCFYHKIIFRYRREKSRTESKDKYSHTDYSSRNDDNRKNYDHKRDFKRNVSFLLITLFEAIICNI